MTLIFHSVMTFLFRPIEPQGDVDSLARERISAFSLSADVVKLTDEEAEWLCGVSPQEALQDPSCLSEFFPAAKVCRHFRVFANDGT